MFSYRGHLHVAVYHYIVTVKASAVIMISKCYILVQREEETSTRDHLDLMKPLSPLS